MNLSPAEIIRLVASLLSLVAATMDKTGSRSDNV